MANQERQIKALERQKQALELRMAGVSYATIAEQLGYSDMSGAHRAVGRALKRTLQEPADKLRELEAERLDKLLLGLWPSRTNLGVVDRILRIMERRAKLLGLDAPTKVAQTDPTGEHEAELVQVLVYMPDNQRDPGGAQAPQGQAGEAPITPTLPAPPQLPNE